MAEMRIKLCHDAEDPQGYLPYTHLRAVKDSNGNNAQSLIDALREQIQQAVSGQIVDGSVTLVKLEESLQKKINGIQASDVTTTKSLATAQIAGETDYLTTTAQAVGKGDKVKLNAGDSLALADGTIVWTAVVGNDTYTEATGQSYYIRTSDASGNVSFDYITTEVSFSVKDGTISMTKLASDVTAKFTSIDNNIQDKTLLDDVTLTRDAVSKEISVKDGGITLAKLANDVATAINDAGKADGTTIVKNADSTLSVIEPYTAEERTKLAGVEADADVNIIEKVQVAGVDLAVSAKAVNVPKASADAYGVVKVSVDGETLKIGI